MTQVKSTSGSYSASTVTDLYTNSSGETATIVSVSAYNPATTANVIEMYVTDGSNNVTEWLLYANVAASTLVGASEISWVPNGSKIRFKSVNTTSIICANLYEGVE